MTDVVADVREDGSAEGRPGASLAAMLNRLQGEVEDAEDPEHAVQIAPSVARDEGLLFRKRRDRCSGLLVCQPDRLDDLFCCVPCRLVDST